MKICFLARPSYDVYSTEIFKLLIKKDSTIEAVFITTNSIESKSVSERLKGFSNYEIYETATYLRKNWDSFTLDNLSDFERRYSCEPIWEYIYADRFLVNRDYNYVVKIAAGLLSFFEFVFSKTKPDYYYSECIATYQCYAAFIIGKKLGVQYITQMCARGNLDSTYHYFVLDPYQFNSEMDNDYLSCNYSSEELRRADEYLSDFETKNTTPPAMKLVKSKPKIDKTFILAPLKYLKNRFKPELNDPCSYMYFKSYHDYLNPILFFFRYQKMKKYWCDPDYSKKYVFYPLHYQPEASTCVCAEKYEKQQYYIDSFAKSLPADTVLYVKEHYALLGHKDLQFYKNLRKYPNVFLINPFENSRELIRKSVAVTTLTGTAGLEAMLLRKPVILGGNSVYQDAPGVMKTNDIYGKYISLMTNWKQPKREDVIKYLCACFRSYHKGNIYCQNYKHLLSANIEYIVDSLFEKLIELGNC